MIWKHVLGSILLGSGIGVALGYVVAPPYSETKGQDREKAKVELASPKREEDLCDRIPDKILDASAVKYCEDNAQYVLIHIRQIHDAKDIPEWREKEIIAVQKEIYQLLIHLKEKYGIDEVYTEGNVFGEGIENSQCRLVKGWKTLEDTINSGTELLLLSKRYDDAISKEEKERIKREVLTKYEQFKRLEDSEHKRDLLFLNCGADRILEMEGEMKTLVGEDLQTYRTASNDHSNTDYVMRRRENSLLQIVASEGKPLNVTVFGGAHYFWDNISEWNLLHPDQKFSLVTITPTAYPY